ncbi:MAG: hypothetical protein IKR78_05045 [Dehalococcoidales bacterium]|nr:hypothetical protein [Dehalococcoidales bacterium]
MDRIYAAIDLKSFYASVECVARGLDPLTTNLVVADKTRTDKTICLAVTPSLKAYGISGRARLFEVNQAVSEINAKRIRNAFGRRFKGSSFDATELDRDKDLSLDFIIAPPQMAYYIEVSDRIYSTYLKYIAPDDIHVYSIDEVFIDLTHYVDFYKKTPHDILMMIISDVLKTTGITATGGIGTNLFLAKVAMDVYAKHIQPDENGVRIAELDELSYRRLLWDHKPITDFWRVGHGYAKRLASIGLETMGDIARCSVGRPDQFYNEDRLYKLFGINAELLIDHAWGWEPCTLEDIRSYRPENNSLSSGQVLKEPYPYDKARIIVSEMTDLLVLDMVDKGLVADQFVLTVVYDVENLRSKTSSAYKGEVKADYYGRMVPKHAHGTANLGKYSSSTKLILGKILELFDSIVDRKLTIRRIYVVANHIMPERYLRIEDAGPKQLDLFTDFEEQKRQEDHEKEEMEKERRGQDALIKIRKKYGKNAILKGMNFEEGATTIERNNQIGGHRAR